MSVTADSHECVTPPTSLSQEKGAYDSNYQTFHIRAPSVTNAFVYYRNTLRQMLASFQADGQCCSCKLTCHETLMQHSLPCVSASSEPKKLTCLCKENSGLSLCTFKLDLILFLNSLKTRSYSVLCMLNDTGVGIKERISSNGFMHKSRNIFTVCNIEGGFHEGLVNTDAGFDPDYVTNVNSAMFVSCSCEMDVEDSTVSLLEMCNTSLVECIGGKRSSSDLGCNFGNFGASPSESYFDLNDSEKMALHVVYNSPVMNHFDIFTKKVCSSSLDIIHSPMTMVSVDSIVGIHSSVHSHGIMQGNLIVTQFSEDNIYSGCCTSVKVTELSNSESVYDSNEFTSLKNLTCLYPVSEGTGSNVTCILQLFCPLQDMCISSIGQELLNNQNGQGIVAVYFVCRELINFNAGQYEFDREVKNITDTMARFLCQICSNSDHLVLGQDCKVTSSSKWSSVLLQELSILFREGYSVCNFHKHDVQNMLHIAEFRNDPCSQIMICRSFHCASTPLLQLYPFCTCLLLRWLCCELLAGPISSVPFRYFYRCYHLLCLVSKFKCLFLSLSDSISVRNRLLCIMCLERH